MNVKFLKIKLKSLAAEARIIRREELRLCCSPRLGEEVAQANTAARTSLYIHRVCVVRREARHTHLAYGFLRGRSYRQLEGTAERVTCRESPDLSKVARMVRKYGRYPSDEAALEAVRGWVYPVAVKKVA